MGAPEGYTTLQIRLHWAIVLLVTAQLLSHDGMARAWDAALQRGEFALSAPVILHFLIGGVILGGMMWRLALRQEHGVPPPPAQEPALMQALARWAHRGFYAVLILLPVTGGLAWGMRSPGLSTAHEVLRLALVVLIVAHVGAVIHHQRVLRTGFLQRMTRAARRD